MSDTDSYVEADLNWISIANSGRRHLDIGGGVPLNIEIDSRHVQKISMMIFRGRHLLLRNISWYLRT